MMTNNMMSNINKNKLNMTKLEQQYSTGKKIQRPSEDPIVAVRALRLRTNLSELEQYTEKNIPDAMSWMDVTESALSTVNNVLQKVNTYCVQGSTDTLTPSDRSAIAENLKQLKQQIYQEGNANYAGRHIFTGYKTDTSLIFKEDTNNIAYSITENFTGDQIQVKERVKGSYELEDYDNTGVTFNEAPLLVNTYRLQLSYDELSSTAPDNIRFFKKNATGELVEQTPFTNITSVSVLDDDAYTPADDAAHYIPETGEIILGKDVYEMLRTADNMKVTYDKTGFEQGDLRPEHYFDCVMTDNSKPEQEPITYTKTDQQIQYEINYNQKLTVNTQGSDAFTHQIGRNIDEIVSAVADVTIVEEKIAEIEKRLSDTTLSEADVKRYEKMKGQLDTELVLKKEIMQKAFEKGMSSSTQEQDRVNTALADLGSRYVRLELTESRLSTQKVDFEDLLSKNEEVDLVETAIKFNSAETIYNASLSAASRVVQNTLLDFLR
jgi:flagellar hook-associated protein 3 FlgL